MSRLLITTAFAGLLMSGGAMAQPPDGRDHSFGNFGTSTPAPKAAPAAPPARAAAPRGDNSRNDNDRRSDNDRRGNPGADNRGNNRGGRDFGRGRDRNNFSSYNRNFRSEHRFRGPTYNRPRGWYSHRWTFGEILPSLFWSNSYWINDYYSYGLMSPPPGTVWVRDGSDALLIDRYNGQIIQVAYDVFY